MDPARAILAQRARALARRKETAPAGEELIVVGFTVGDAAFCIEALYVREIVRLRHVANVPGAPVAVRGVTTYSGEILALIDVRAALGLPDGGLRDLLWVVVVGTRAAEFGLLADSVTGVTAIRVDQLQRLAQGSSVTALRLARTVTPQAAVVLDGAALLSDTELFAGHESASAVDVGG